MLVQRFFHRFTVNLLPNNKFLDWSKLKAFTDDKINLTQKQKFFLGWAENIVGKEEKISPFPTMFSKGFFFRIFKRVNQSHVFHDSKEEVENMKKRYHEETL